MNEEDIFWTSQPLASDFFLANRKWRKSLHHPNLSLPDPRSDASMTTLTSGTARFAVIVVMERSRQDARFAAIAAMGMSSIIAGFAVIVVMERSRQDARFAAIVAMRMSSIIA